MTTHTQYNLCLDTVSNETRVQILNLLKAQPMSVTQIATSLGSERSRISHSLQILLGCSLVTVEDSGKERIYHLNEKSYYNTIAEHGTIEEALKAHMEENCSTCYKLPA